LGDMQPPDAAVQQAGDPLAVALWWAHYHREVERPPKHRHVGDGLDRRRRMLHVDAGVVHAGALHQRQDGRIAHQIQPGSDLDPTFLERGLHRVRLHGGTSLCEKMVGPVPWTKLHVYDRAWLRHAGVNDEAGPSRYPVA